MTDSPGWPTQCHELLGWDTDKCCAVCHSDAEEMGIEPCSVKLGKRELFVCCKAWEWWILARAQEYPDIARLIG